MAGGQQPQENDVPVYLFTGFLEAGKTKFIQETLEDKRFNSGEKTMLLLCEEGEEEYDISAMPCQEIYIRTIEEPEELNPAHLQELLKENAPIDAPKAASILRNRKGVGEAELGLANEMAINQFIAHHSVIFQPEKKRMWVSTAPWQCGKYVAYDLNRIFSDSIDFNHEIYTENLTVPADSFLQQQEYQQLMTYKRLAPVLRKQIKKKERLDEQTLHAFQHANPHFFYVYELLGDYYHATGQQDKALRNWKKALLLPIPKRSESERIEHKINN